MPPKLLLFDIDGTLLLSNGAGGRAMAQAGERLFGPSFSFAVDTAGMLDPHIYRDLVTANGHLNMAGAHDGFRDAYIEILEAELQRTGSEAYALPGVADLLSTLQMLEGLTLGLLTGNYAPSAHLKLRAAALNHPFAITIFGDEAETRPGLVRVALQKYRALRGESLEPRQIVVIGDTPKDVDCAHANGCTAFGVATGRYSAAELRAAGADFVVEDLLEPSALLSLVTPFNNPTFRKSR